MCPETMRGRKGQEKEGEGTGREGRGENIRNTHLLPLKLKCKVMNTKNRFELLSIVIKYVY